MKHKLTKLKGEIDHSEITLGDFSTPFLIMHRIKQTHQQEKYSVSLGIRKKQIKITVSNHYETIKMA